MSYIEQSEEYRRYDYIEVFITIDEITYSTHKQCYYLSEKGLYLAK